MKKVFGSHRQLAHVWAQQNQPEGRSSDGRMFFDGPTLYSYGRHYAIAKFSTDRKGNPIVLFNSAGYSLSTATHTRYARAAVSIPTVSLRDPERDPKFAIEAIDTEFANLVKRYGTTTHAGAKAKQIREMEKLLAERNAIGEALIKGYRVKTLPKNLAQHAVKLVAADKAKAEAAEAKRLADIEDSLVLAEESLGAKRDAWPAMWRANFMPPLTYEASEVSAWRRALHYLCYDRDTVLMRVKSQGGTIESNIPELNGIKAQMSFRNTIETSRGAEFPVDAALRALPVIRRMKKQRKSWQRNGETLPLGSFQIDTIYPDGNVKAGCHLVTYTEIELLAKELGQ